MICDRYPQIQVKGHNDGPLLGPWFSSKSRLKSCLAAWEFEIYAQAMQTSLDLDLKLDLPPEITAGRRPGMTIEELGRRWQVVRAIDYSEPCKHVTIDTSEDLNKVVLNVKRAILERL